MGYVRETPFVPVNEEAVSIDDFKKVVSDHQIVTCDKVGVLKAIKKGLVGSYYKDIVNWLIDNPDSFEIVKDFNGYDFGVEIEERLGRVYFRVPVVHDEEVYKDYNSREFNSMGNPEKLEYIKNSKNYVPVKINKERFYVDNLSHMWSHIKMNEDLMKDLDQYIKTSTNMPHFKIFYFIRYDEKRDMVYLKRDYNMSPRVVNESEGSTVTEEVELPSQITATVLVNKREDEENKVVNGVKPFSIEYQDKKEPEEQTVRVEEPQVAEVEVNKDGGSGEA